MRFEVDEDLWFGGSPDDPAEAEAARSMALVVARVYGLRAFPGSVQRLLALTADPDFRLADVVRTLEGDASLASRVLRLVNSAAYSLRVRCTSISHAVTLLGARAIGEVAMATAVLDLFQEQMGPSAAVREHSAVVAGLARFLAVRLRVPPEDVFTAGLLHDIGKLLMLQVEDEEVPAGYLELLVEAGNRRDTAHLLERERYGYDHAVLGGHVLRAWDIPEPVPTVVAWHHQPARAFAARGEAATLVSLVRLADRLSYDLGLEARGDGPLDTDAARIADIARDESSAWLGLGPERLADLWPDLQVAYLESRQLVLGR